LITEKKREKGDTVLASNYNYNYSENLYSITYRAQMAALHRLKRLSLKYNIKEKQKILR